MYFIFACRTPMELGQNFSEDYLTKLLSFGEYIFVFTKLNALYVVAVITVISLLTVACNRSSSPATAANQLASNIVTLDVMIHDSYYGDADTNVDSPPEWVVPSGADVLVNMENQGELTHNWAIVKRGAVVSIPYEEGQSSDILLYGAGMVYANNQTMITFIAPEPGEYQVICTVAGHYPFMQGRLIVE